MRLFVYRLTTSRLCSFAFSGTAAAAADAAADAAERYICKRVEGKKNENRERKQRELQSAAFYFVKYKSFSFEDCRCLPSDCLVRPVLLAFGVCSPVLSFTQNWSFSSKKKLFHAVFCWSPSCLLACRRAGGSAAVCKGLWESNTSASEC